MKIRETRRHSTSLFSLPERALALVLALIFLIPWDLTASIRRRDADTGTTPAVSTDSITRNDTVISAQLLIPATATETGDSIVVTADNYPYGLDGKKIFNPDPTRAVWLSALFPGLGQIYNRRYWKLPIIVAGFMGLGYGTSWNNNQYQDYSQAYRDLLDADPSSNSYMNFFPPTTKEEDLDKNWLQQTMRSRKNYYRRNRDLCIICIVGLYLLCMVDAYVDASMAHFDITPNLSMDVAPAMFIDPGMSKPAVGLNWALNF